MLHYTFFFFDNLLDECSCNKDKRFTISFFGVVLYPKKIMHEPFQRLNKSTNEEQPEHDNCEQGRERERGWGSRQKR